MCLVTLAQGGCDTGSSCCLLPHGWKPGHGTTQTELPSSFLSRMVKDPGMGKAVPLSKSPSGMLASEGMGTDVALPCSSLSLQTSALTFRLCLLSLCSPASIGSCSKCELGNVSRIVYFSSGEIVTSAAFKSKLVLE